MLILRISLLSVLLLSCVKREMIVQKELEDFVGQRFSEDLIAEIDESLMKQIDTIRKYSLPSLGFESSTEWQILSPILISENKRRCVILVGVKGYGGDLSNHVDIDCVLGFKYQDDWYFKGGSYMPLLLEDAGGQIVHQYTFERINDIAVKKVMQRYLIRDKASGEWKVNKSFFDGSFKSLTLVQQRADMSIHDLPESFWFDKDYRIVQINNRRIELINERWKKQDEQIANGELSDEEIKQIEGERHPQTVEDWKMIRKRNIEINRDSIIRSIRHYWMNRVR